MNQIHKGIEVEHLFFSYPHLPVLKDIQLFIRKGEITAIIGPSGSGKSSLLRTFNRIYELMPSVKISGDIRVEGKSIFGPKVDLVALRQRVGMVFQKPTPFPMSIRHNVAFGLRYIPNLSKQEAQRRVVQALKRAALWEEVKNNLSQAGTYLSGGQQQRLCIARALATKPEYLLLDEPTSSLDPISSAKIDDLILRIKDRYTIVLVTHDLRQARRVADTLILMMDGCIVEKGSTRQLFESPKDPRTKEYIAYA